MNDITQLNPQTVWQWFAKICAIPHPSYHETALIDYLLKRVQTDGVQYGLRAEKDSKGNLRIIKPATQGMKNRAAVVLQSHCDMVSQKTDDSTHNFLTDPIQTIIKDNRFVYADRTTLGADNGIGLAMALAVAFSHNIAHPELHIIVTTEEETSMGGAKALNPEWFNGIPYLLNLDSEDDAQLFIGCAGGSEVEFNQYYTTQKQTATTLTIKVFGLHGGHSGIDIHKYRGNANLLLTRLLAHSHSVSPINLVSFNGGTAINAIPRSAEATIVGDIRIITAEIEKLTKIIQSELQFVENNLQVECITHKNTNVTALSHTDTHRILNFVMSFPNGVARMSDSFAGVVETSINAGIILLKEGQFTLQSLARSLGQTQKEAFVQRLAALAQLANMNMSVLDDYPGWLPNPHSPLLGLVQNIMAEHFGKEPLVQVIHAGLECGYLRAKAPHTDMVSFGPNIFNAHSPTEHVEIESVQSNFALLLKILANIPERK
ncbi:beta-Ala-His dipeptidase [Wielerella bovis]|uniref:beta-Ala-His dipeptidase n=1 Tax=Wielerella bovis TaxID=2917790 RepID=UPI0020187EEE|nr:beta-Ala-His dipeptidase [Wielerella bovis]ULJ61664.1 beta-Ala-His dipeptidase [Wielerella bovis]